MTESVRIEKLEAVTVVTLDRPAVRNAVDADTARALYEAFVAFEGDAQARVAGAYQDRENWTRMSILNTAGSGKFSTDRTMAEYNAEIWKLTPGGAGPAVAHRRQGPPRRAEVDSGRAGL